MSFSNNVVRNFRRKLQVVYVKPLDEFVSRFITEAFIKKSVQSASATMAGGSLLTVKRADLGEKMSIIKNSWTQHNL
jgi:hypothetical protein